METENIAPLLWCLDFAIVPHYPVDYFLPGIFTDDENALGGGDPGWVWHREKQSDGTYRYYAWTVEDTSYLDPCEGEYDEATVKYHVRRALENFRQAHPERNAEVDEVIAKYAL
ncbi:hypothetical protein DU000_12500 [Parvibium lacunae]|uniref:Uncharacterized protein n=2 Tax=Parvibium lacunae TaxID=1888893 RepID=A0A368KXW7_9BURK|nr:hypothetical protein DU000_12500 [Parvibium lacunae]